MLLKFQPAIGPFKHTEPGEPLIIDGFVKSLILLSFRAKRIDPFQFRETRKITIRRSNGAPMLQGKGRNMCVCDQVGDRLSVIEHLLK